MTGDVNVNSFKDIQLKAFAQAADQDGNFKLDSVEKRLFENLVEQAGLSMEDEFSSVMGEAAANAPDAKILKKQEKIAEKADEQRYKDAFGKAYNKETMASIRSIEAEANTRVGNAFKRMMGHVDPKKLAAHIAARPDVAKFNSVADYTAALTRWADEMEKLDTATTNELVSAGFNDVKASVTEVKEGVDNLTALSQREFATLNEKIDAVTQFVIQDLMVDLEDLKVDKQDLQIDQQVLKYSKAILKNTNDIKAACQQIKKLVLFDIAVDINTNRVAHADYRVDRDTNRTAHRTENKVDNLTDEVIAARQDILNRIGAAEEHIIDETHRSADPLGINRGIADLKDAIIDGAKKAGKSIRDFLFTPGMSVLGIPAATLVAAKLFD